MVTCMNIYDDRTYERLAKEGGKIPVYFGDNKGYQEVERRLTALCLPRSVKLVADSPVEVYHLFTVKARPEALWELAA